MHVPGVKRVMKLLDLMSCFLPGSIFSVQVEAHLVREILVHRGGGSIDGLDVVHVVLPVDVSQSAVCVRGGALDAFDGVLEGFDQRVLPKRGVWSEEFVEGADFVHFDRVHFHLV